MYDSWRNVTTLEEHWRKRKKGKSVRNKARKQKLFQELILNWIICTLWKTKRCLKIQSLLTRYFHLSFILSLTHHWKIHINILYKVHFILPKTWEDTSRLRDNWEIQGKKQIFIDLQLCWGWPAAMQRATCGYAEGDLRLCWGPLNNK